MLPALRLHMGSCSFTNEWWPEEKQPLPFPAVLHTPFIVPGTEQEIVYSLHFSVCGGLELKSQDGFAVYGQLLYGARKCSTRSSCTCPLSKTILEQSAHVNTCSKQPAQSRGEESLWRSLCRSSLINNINPFVFTDAQEKL